jgi:uroporphyrin-III C-methyltransferase
MPSEAVTMSDEVTKPAQEPVPEPEQLLVAEQAEQKVAKKSEQRAEPVASKQAKPWVLRTLFNLLLLAALGLLGWISWQQQAALQNLGVALERMSQQEQTLEARLVSIDVARQALETLQQDQAARLVQQQESLAATLVQQQEGLDARIARQLQEQSDQLASVNADLARVRLQSREAGSSASTVQLDEAAALLRLARERLLGAQDLATAISLYLASDEILQSFDDPAVQQVRQILSRELASLRAVQVPDVATMHAELGRIKQATAMLVIASEFSGDAPRFISPAENPDTQTTGWLAALTSSLGQHFVITQRNTPVLPRLTDEGAMLIRLGIDLQLEQARLALLLGESVLYQATLLEAASSIAGYLEGSTKVQILTSLERLRDENIRADIPPVGGALNALGLLLTNPVRREQP